MRWITRERPKIDRVACPWLITRFLDEDAEFIFVPPRDVLRRAKELDAVPFDVEGVKLSHRGDRCSFDAFLDDYALSDTCLRDLADIVRGADTSRLDLAPQAAGLLSVSLGLSRLCLGDDQRMLAHGFVVYDALYEWLKHGRGEVHGWGRGTGKATGEPAWDRFRSGRVEVVISARRATVSGRRVLIPSTEFALLVVLMAREGRVLSRPFLLQHVWDYAPDVASRTVDWHVAKLRRRLGAAGASIETVRGEGYRWSPLLAVRDVRRPRPTRRSTV